MSKKNKELLTKYFLYLCFFVVVLFFIFPFLWVLSLSLKSSSEIYNINPIPEKFNLDNYLHVIQNNNILTYLANSALIVVLTVILVLIIAIPAAFALSRYRFKLKPVVLLTILMTQMISAVVVSIPLYRLFAKMDLLNNLFFLIVVYAAIVLPFSTWFLKGYIDTVPKDLDEAAIIDGCNIVQVLTRIVIPSSVPGIISVVILVAVQSWSQFVIPFILLDDIELYPVSVGIMNLQSTQQAITTHYLAAGSILSVIPVIIIFVLLQRFIVGALTSGAVKG